MTTVAAAGTRNPGLLAIHARVTSPPNWLGRKLFVKAPRR